MQAGLDSLVSIVGYEYEYGYGDTGVNSYSKYGSSDYKYGSKYYPWKDYDGYYSKW